MELATRKESDSALRPAKVTSMVSPPAMPLEDVPDELLLMCCDDGSMRMCVKLASASKVLRVKLQCASASRGLRLVAEHGRMATRIKRQLRGSFDVGELVLWSDVLGNSVPRKSIA